jgi:hypothetical protein
MKAIIRKMWRRFLAYYRLDLQVVCEESKDGRDYHDYPDWFHGQPLHFHEEACKRCGKVFGI